jgi:uncharacterized iron-regulated membrane protein
MPLERSTKYIMILTLIGVCVAVALFVAYVTISQIDALMYIGVVILYISAIAATFGLVLMCAGIGICWVTYAQQKSDDRRRYPGGYNVP